jgi:hypothetical protein
MIPPTIEAAEAEGWKGLRVTCKTHGVKRVSWSGLRLGDNRRISISALVDKLRCYECRERPAIVELESDTGTVLIQGEVAH